MPKDVTSSEPLSNLWLGLYDSGEEENLSIIAERVVDVTDICAETQMQLGQTVIKYGRAKRGMIAQLEERNDFQGPPATQIHFFPEERGLAGLATDEAFIWRAQVLGCDSLLLAETMLENIPEPGPVL